MGLLNYLFWGAGIVAGALSMFAFNTLTNGYKIEAAVLAERAVQVQACDGRVAKNANAINAENDAALDAAMDARDTTGRTPIDQAQLQDLCNAEEECRDRVAQP